MTSVTPTRLLDSRTDGGPLAAGRTVTVPVAGRAGIPAIGLLSVEVDVTVTGAAAAGHLTAYATGTAQPGTSFLDYTAGQTISAPTMVSVSSDGAFTIYSSAQTQVIVDVDAYASQLTDGDPSSSYSYLPVTPTRIVDTRQPGGPQTPTGRLTTRETITVPDDPPAMGSEGIGAVVNVTVVHPAATGVITTYAAGYPGEPQTSLINFTAGETVANLAVVFTDNGQGTFSLTTNAATDLIVDVLGYVNDGSGPSPTGGIVPFGPTRLIDTRDNNEAVTAGHAVTVHVDGAQAPVGDVRVPSTQVAAAVVNVTVVQPRAAGFLTAYGGPARPAVSSVSYASGQTTADELIVPIGAGGAITVYTTATAYVIVDLVAYTVLDTTPPGPDTALQAGSTASAVTLTWTPPTDADLYGAEVVRSPGSVPPSSPTDGTAVTLDAGFPAATDVGLTPETTYSYAVFAEDTSGNLAPAATATVSTTGTQTATALSAGYDAVCAQLATGTADCWGGGMDGSLGNGTQGAFAYPVAATELGSTSAAQASYFFGCGLAPSGTVSCLGEDDGGQLGDGYGPVSTTPVAVPGVQDASAITLGEGFACALERGGTIECWGDNDQGDLGDGGSNSTGPVVVSGITDATLVSAGYSHACAVVGGGQVDCWGAGDLGNASTGESSTPVAVSGLTGVTALSAAEFDTCAVVSGGAVDCWGANTEGQLGDGGTVASTTPVPVTGVQGAVSVAVGTYHACALLASGTVDCWGDNRAGQLGNGTTTNSDVAVAVSGLTDATGLTATAASACALVAAGGVVCWGSAGSGALGNGAFTPASDVPVAVVGLGSPTSGVAAP